MRRSIFLFILILFAFNVFAQKNVTVTGFVCDSITGEVLIGATVSDDGSRGVLTDNSGFFNFMVDAQSIITASYVGYTNRNIMVVGDTLITVRLSAKNQIEEVIVRAAKPAMSNTVRLSPKEILSIPSLTGKPDVGRVLQVMPGITTQNEGSTLLMVRGGDPGQNLYLFDNVPVIYVNHIGGFMSVFNPEIINSIDLYKGGFPARLGGRLSSVVDITQREGNISKRCGSLSIGITDVSATIEGPTPIKNTSFIVTGRKTVFEPYMLWGTKNSDGNDNITAFGFHDINGKFTWKPNFRNVLSLNVYEGDDYMWSKQKMVEGQSSYEFQDGRNSYIWGNWLMSASWKQLIGDKMIATHNLSYTRYRLKEKSTFTSFNYSGESQSVCDLFFSEVKDVSLRSMFKYNLLTNWTMEFGFQGSLLYYLPFYASTDRIGTEPKIYTRTLEDALFFESRIAFFSSSYITLGLRGVGYYNSGYSNYYLEPRIGVLLNFGQNQSINANYTKVRQNSHLIFCSQADIMRSEVWVPASEEAPSSVADQVSLGWRGEFIDEMYGSEITFFYKKMSDLATIKDGYTSFRGNAHWQQLLANGGIGTSKGVEVLLKKSRGKFSGFIGYTISRATRRYDEINGGKEFLFGFDRKHDLSVSLSYKISEKLDINLLWVCQSGLPYTPAEGSFLAYDNGNFEEAIIYGERNSARMRCYNRLDVGLKYNKIGWGGRRVEWNFSVYNLYSRQNPYRYFYNTQPNDDYFSIGNGSLKLYQTAYFPIIPSISYKVYFDGNRTNRRNGNGSFWQRVNNWLHYK